MSRIRLRRPSPALILSAAAFFLALGGAAYAVPASFSTTVSKPSVVRTSFDIAAGGTESRPAMCPKGSYATGGGVGEEGGASSSTPAVVEDSGPVNSSGKFVDTITGSRAVEWYGTVANDGSSTITEYVWVICQHYGR